MRIRVTGMHDEFGLGCEGKSTRRLSLVCYGCCEALHDKIDIPSTIPNLRKVSLSPFADVRKAAERIGRRHVASLKPSPIPCPHDDESAEREMAQLRRNLENPRGCNVEVVLKGDISIRLEPQRVWGWVQEAQKVVREFE